MKTCVSCKKEYPKTSEHFFYRNKLKGWLSSWCKSCRKLNRVRTSERELEMQRLRRGDSKRVEGVAYFINRCRICSTTEMMPRTIYCNTCRAEKNRNQKRYDKALYKSRLRKAKPPWANAFFLREIYSLARLRTKLTGIEWHVDHIIPLSSKHVCGLHVHDNLQVIPAVSNLIKSNHYSMEHNGRM